MKSIPMTAHLSDELVERFRSRQISPEDLFAAERHLAFCEECRRRLSAKTKTSDQVNGLWTTLRQALDEPRHPTRDVLSSYANSLLGAADREIVELHLEDCRSCAESVLGIEKSGAADQLLEVGVSPKRDNVELAPIGRWFGMFRPAHAVGLMAALGLVLLISLYISRRGTSEVKKPEIDQTLEATNTRQYADVAARQPSSPLNSSSFENRSSGVRRRENGKQLKDQANHQSRKPQETHASDARIINALNDGGRPVMLDSRGRVFGIENLTPNVKRLITAALTNGKLEEAQNLAGVASRNGVTLKGNSENDEFAVIGPVGTLIRDDQPTFCWQALKGAKNYTITVVRRGQVVVATSGPITATEWQPAVGQLRPGTIYQWGVVAERADGTRAGAPGPTEPQARFKILSPGRVDQIERIASRYSRSSLTLGVIYAREGLIDDAERQFTLLLQQNPKSTLARKLLESAQRLRFSEPLPRQ